MTHTENSSRSGRHLQYFCHTCFAIHCMLLLRSLNDFPVPDQLFGNNLPGPQDALTQHLTRKDFDYWL